MSSSGRRQSVLIFCASAVKDLYLMPARHYLPDSIHVFLDGSDGSLAVYERELFSSVRDELGCGDITEHTVDTRDYNTVLGTLIGVKKELLEKYGEDLDIYINISSGTSEFSAAAMFASMLPRSCIAFRVSKTYALGEERRKDILAELNGSSAVSVPSRVTGLENRDPDEEMMEFLSIVADLLEETRYPRVRQMIDGLKESGYWSYDPGRKSGFGRTSLEDKEERYLQRHYMAVALENGWLEKTSARAVRMTDKGRAYISVYRRSEMNCCARLCANHDLSGEPYDEECSVEELVLPQDENCITVDSNGRTYRIRLGLE